MNKIIKLCIHCLFVAVFVAIITGTGFAGSSNNTYSGYPSNFNGSGIVDMFNGGKYISINDSSYEITENTKFNRPGNLNCSKRWFKTNDFVYYILESDSQKIKSLWFTKDKYLGGGKP